MSQRSLKVATVSHNIAWGDKDENIISVAELLNRVDKDTDIVVLPELFCSGFMSTLEQLHEMAEDNTGVTIINLQRWAQYFKFAICGSYLAKENGRYFNRAFFVEPSGDITYYDKRHLHTPSNENICYEKGNKLSPIIRFRGWNISMLICYDIRFPIWCRNLEYKVDLMLIPANWPKKDCYTWKHLLIARAIENQMFVVGANRSGSDDMGDYDELSYVFDFKGVDIGYMSTKSDKIIHAKLDKKSLEKYRCDFPIINDFDQYQLCLK